jgi:hypothetical protein
MPVVPASLSPSQPPAASDIDSGSSLNGLIPARSPVPTGARLAIEGSRLERLKTKRPVALLPQRSEELRLDVDSLPHEPVLDLPESIRLLGRYRSANILVMIERKAWSDSPQLDEHARAHWVLSKAIQGLHLTPTGGSMAPMLIAWTRQGERLERLRYPTDFDSLAKLGRTGLEFEATVGLRGGMDSVQPDGGEGQPSEAPEQPVSVSMDLANMNREDLQLLDATMLEIMAGRGLPITPLSMAARQLLAPIQENFAGENNSTQTRCT